MSNPLGKYIINWVKSPQGNSIKEGTRLEIIADPDIVWFAYAIIQNSFPIFIGQTMFGDQTDSILIKRKGFSVKGKATLRIFGYNASWQKFGIKDQFEIV